MSSDCNKQVPSLLQTPGGNKAAIQGNGEVAAEAAGSNGYMCSGCSLLAERKGALTACSAAHGPVSRIYSRDRHQKRKSCSFKSEGKSSRPNTGYFIFFLLALS